MYTSYIGQRFLALWNERTGHDLSARQFFDEEMFPLFYDSAKYLQWVASSPFAQDLNKEEKGLVLNGRSPYEIKLGKFHEKVNSGLQPDGSFAVGFPAADTIATTSGQVSNTGPRIDAEEIYCTWIGSALGIGVGSSFSILLDEDEVLWALYKGWALYRLYLDQRLPLKANQIDTWNGQWLAHVFDDEVYKEHEPTAGFMFDDKIEIKDGTASIRTQSWVKTLFVLARKYKRRILAYAYSFSKQNKTLGFIPLEMKEVENLYELSQKLFELSPTIRSWNKLADVYETHYNFKRACEQGSIGLAAIEPAKLQEYMPGKDRKISPKTEADRIQLDIYQLWIIAMLNNQELYGAADRLADALLQFAHRDDGRNAGRGKTNTSQQVEQVFVKHRPAFIEKLTELLSAVKSEEPYCSVFDEVVRHIMGMPVDNFPLFIILTRFRYVARQGTAASVATETSHS